MAAQGVLDSDAPPSAVVVVLNEQDVGEWAQIGDVVARAHRPSKCVAGAATSAVDGQRRRSGGGPSPDGRPQLPPEGEVRTLAQVSDPKALLEQDAPSEEFFARFALHFLKLARVFGRSHTASSRGHREDALALDRL
jgi:hypothetical protein